MNIRDKINTISAKTLQVLERLNTPELIQQYIDEEIIYDPYREDRTLNEIVQDGQAECFNGALFAAACLDYHSHEKVGLIQLEAIDDEEHVLAIYQLSGRWGSIAQSKFLGLKSRDPMYLSIDDLCLSYKEFYFSFDGHYCMKGYREYISLTDCSYDWINKTEAVNQLSKDLASGKLTDVHGQEKPYIYIAPKRYWNEVLFIPKEVQIPDKYTKVKP